MKKIISDMKLIKIILVILWMALIFIFSNQPGDDSSKLSDGIILKTVRFVEKIIDKDFDDEVVLEKFVKPVRKLAHFTIYLILGLLVILTLQDYNLDIQKQIILSILICIIYACSDEIHQLFISGRSGEILDVFIDSLGSFLGISLFSFVKRKYQNF